MCVPSTHIKQTRVCLSVNHAQTKGQRPQTDIHSESRSPTDGYRHIKHFRLWVGGCVRVCVWVGG